METELARALPVAAILNTCWMGRRISSWHSLTSPFGHQTIGSEPANLDSLQFESVEVLQDGFLLGLGSYQLYLSLLCSELCLSVLL